MIILSVGMPRAGSGWHYNLTHDLILASGGQDARQIRERYHLQRILTEVNCNIGVLNPPRLAAVTIPALMGNTFVIKAHARLTPAAHLLARRGFLRPTYIFRDPRDAMLSAIEFGQRTAQKGQPNAFSHLKDFETAMRFIKTYLLIWDSWMACPQAHHLRYEDLLTDYDQEVLRLLQFLEINQTDSPIQSVIERYRPAQAKEIKKGVHYSKGKIGRFRKKFSVEQQSMLANEFGSYLKKMGYEV